MGMGEFFQADGLEYESVNHSTLAPSNQTRTPSFSASAWRAVKLRAITGIEWNEICISSSPGWRRWPVIAIEVSPVARRFASSKRSCSSSEDCAAAFPASSSTSARKLNSPTGSLARILEMWLEGDMKIYCLSHQIGLCAFGRFKLSRPPMQALSAIWPAAGLGSTCSFSH